MENRISLINSMSLAKVFSFICIGDAVCGIVYSRRAGREIRKRKLKSKNESAKLWRPREAWRVEITNVE